MILSQVILIGILYKLKDKDDKQVEKVIKDNAGEDKPNEYKYTVEKNGKYTVSVIVLDATYQPIGASVSKEVALKKTVYYSLTILATENGRASMAVGTQEYKAGEEVSLLPIADEGYVFEKWMMNGSVKNTENLVLTMDEDYKVKPIFKPQDVAVGNIPVGESGVQKLLRDGKIYNVIGREM